MGEHNAQVLADYLGYPAERIDHLETSGVLKRGLHANDSSSSPNVRQYDLKSYSDAPEHRNHRDGVAVATVDI